MLSPNIRLIPNCLSCVSKQLVGGRAGKPPGDSLGDPPRTLPQPSRPSPLNPLVDENGLSRPRLTHRGGSRGQRSVGVGTAHFQRPMGSTAKRTLGREGW